MKDFNSKYFLFCRRCQDDVVQLQEISLDCNLVENNVQLRFSNSRLLPHIVIKETDRNVTILLATDHSVHRFTLSHPSKVSKNTTVRLDIIINLICIFIVSVY